MAASVSDKAKDQVLEKLKSVLEDTEDLARVTFFLLQGEDSCKGADGPPSKYWKNMSSLLNSGDAFEKLAKRLADETKNSTFMEKMHQGKVDSSEKVLSKDQQQARDVDHITKDPTEAEKDDGSRKALISNVASRILQKFPRLAVLVGKIIVDGQLARISVVEGVVGFASKWGAEITSGALAVTYLGYKIARNFKRWWKGDISGKRCAKIFIDESLTTAAAMGGGVAGMALGTMVGGPGVGTAAGGIVGGIAASSFTSFIVDRLTQWLFGLPQDEALENAYRFLGVKHTASNEDVSRAFHKLCLKHHPDKGGNEEDFLKLQVCMQLIRDFREKGNVEGTSSEATSLPIEHGKA